MVGEWLRLRFGQGVGRGRLVIVKAWGFPCVEGIVFVMRWGLDLGGLPGRGSHGARAGHGRLHRGWWLWVGFYQSNRLG